MYIFLFFGYLAIFYSAVQAQSGFSGRIDRTTNHILKGFSESVELYDIPIAAAFFSTNIIKPEYDDRISISPFPFEYRLQSEIGSNNYKSIGSLDKNVIPYAIQISRMLYNVGSDLFTETGSSSEAYKHSFLFQKSLIYTYTFTEIIKNFTYRERPDKSDARSFFSGHSSTTFTTAAFLYREVDDLLDGVSDEWTRKAIKYSSFSVLYGWAGCVAYSRMRDNKHYFTDVLTGAVTGILIGNLIYDGYFSGENKTYEFNLNYYKNTPSVVFVYNFK